VEEARFNDQQRSIGHEGTCGSDQKRGPSEADWQSALALVYVMKGGGTETLLMFGEEEYNFDEAAQRT